MNEICVTGAAGFIGRWVVAELLDRGHRVVGLDDLSNGDRENVAEFRDVDRFRFVEGDVRRAEDLAEVVTDDTDACVHLAAEIDVHESLEDPGSHFQTNVVGTYETLEACRRTDTKVVVVGTCMVYDVARADRGIDEGHPVDPASPYAGSKLAAENLAISYHHGYGLPVVLLRPFNTYGPYQETGVVQTFVDLDRRGETLTIYGDGTQTRDLMYATDCARFVVDATFDDAAVGEVLNAGTGRDVSVNELAALVAGEDTPVEHVEHHHPQSEIEELRCDSTRAEELLGWAPEVTVEEGVDRVREWLEEREAP
jgi:UDP-glucose 4-epimerase